MTLKTPSLQPRGMSHSPFQNAAKQTVLLGLIKIFLETKSERFSEIGGEVSRNF